MKINANALKWLKSTWERLLNLALSRKRTFRYVNTAELPDYLETGKVYILGEASYLWCAVMICPCGCNETLHMNLLSDAKPKWSIARHPDGTLTIYPSIWRKIGCRSHFFVRKGRIIWVDSPENDLYRQ